MSTSSIVTCASGSSRDTSMSRMSPGPYKTLAPSAAAQTLFKASDDELRHKGMDELVHIVRRLEADTRSLLAEHGSIIKDVNRRTQINLLEIRGLKDINQKLQDDNQELRDLCCFLDDDRQRGRKLAREWQRFGRYTASVMRSEVSAYQEKLKDLEMKQDELIADNAELKELCLYLDQERLLQTRDDGDGSSNSTTAGNEETSHQAPMANDQQPTEDSRDGYLKQLEEKVKRLEHEQNQNDKGKSSPEQRKAPIGIPSEHSASSGADSPSKPEAVVRAMKVLEVHELLERPQTDTDEDNLGDKEKAIVREMCNVVWRKLGDVGPDGEDSDQSNPQTVYENIPRRQAVNKPPMSPPHRNPPPPPPPPSSIPLSQHSRHQQIKSPPGYYEGQSPGFTSPHPSVANSTPPSSTSVDYSMKPPVQHVTMYHSPPPGGGSDTSIPVPGTTHTVHAHAVPSPQQYRSPPPPPPPPLHSNKSRPPPPPHVPYQYNYYQDRPVPPPYNAHMSNQAPGDVRFSQDGDPRGPSHYPQHPHPHPSQYQYQQHAHEQGDRNEQRYTRDPIRQHHRHDKEGHARRDGSVPRDGREFRDGREPHREFRDGRESRESSASRGDPVKMHRQMARDQPSPHGQRFAQDYHSQGMYSNQRGPYDKGSYH